MNPEQVYRLLDVAMQHLGPRYEVLRLGTSYRHPDGSHYSLLRRQLMEAAEAVSARFVGEVIEAPVTAPRQGPEPLTREALQALFDRTNAAMTVRTMPGLPPGHVYVTAELVPVGQPLPWTDEEEVDEGAAEEEKPQEDKSRWDF